MEGYIDIAAAAGGECAGAGRFRIVGAGEVDTIHLSHERVLLDRRAITADRRKGNRQGIHRSVDSPGFQARKLDKSLRQAAPSVKLTHDLREIFLLTLQRMTDQAVEIRLATLL
jgi:hypothetical protein